MKEHLVIICWLLVAVLIDGVVSTGTLDQLSVRAETPGSVGRTRSEIDLETDKSVIICAGQNKSLECVSPGSSIAIQEAFWGRLSSEICPSEDGDPVTNCLSDPSTTPIVRNLCDDKEYCEIPARHSVLQPPGVKHCPGVNKYVAVKYTCMPEKRKFVLCNGETTELTCGQGWKIRILSAYWGRDSPSTCPTPLGKYFTCANSADSVLALKSRCSGRESCIVTADNQHLTKDGDHCPGIDKYAVISYRCQPHQDESDGHANSENKLFGSAQQDAVHSSLDLTSSSKSPAPQSTMSKLNLTMLLPIPQSQASDKLKPIIEFLGEESPGKNLKNSTSLGENLPIPKDARPTVLPKKESSASQSQVGVAPSMLTKVKDISSPSSSSASNPNAAGVFATAMQKFFETKSQQTQLLSSGTASALGSVRQNNDNSEAVDHSVATAVGTNPTEMSSNLPPPGNTEELVKSFLASKFGQTLNPGTLQESSYKSLMAQHFGSTVKPTAAPSTQSPLNKGLIANLVSALMLQSTGQGTTDTSVSLNKNKIIQNSKKISQGSGVTNSNNLSSPTISIGNKVFSLNALSSALNNGSDDEKHVQDKSNDTNLIMGVIKANRKQTNKHKIRRLNEKISTLETLSDALDALTAKLSADEKPKSDEKYQPISLSPEQPNIQGTKQKKHHTHHHHNDHKKNQFDEDIQMLGALLSRANDTHSRTITKERHNPKDKKDSNYIAGINGQKSLNSADLEILQSKINKAIEMAETMGQHDAKQTKSTWLPLLVAGKVIQEEGAHTREEVATIRSNHFSPQGSLSPKNREQHHLQEILTRLIDNALRTGTLNELVQNWNRSGSPFAGIAKNISLFFQHNGGLRMPLTKNVSKITLRAPPAKNMSVTTVKNSLKSQLLMGISGTSPTDSSLFTKAVNNILGVLAKRQSFHKRNSTNQSSYVTTDTLTNFKGILLGGRINKIVPQEDPIAEMESKIMAGILRPHGNQSVKTNSSKLVKLKIENKTIDKSDVNIDSLHGHDNQTLLKPSHDDHGKEELTFSNYDTKNVSRSIRNTTLMDFMNSMSGSRSLNPVPTNKKSGDKYSQVEPHIGDLMSVIVASLLSLNDTDQNSSSNNNKAKVQYDESGKEILLHVVPNDHKLSDYSKADAVLEAPNDHTAKRNSSKNLPKHLLNSTSSIIHTLPQNKTSDLDTKAPTEKEKLDLGDQTVTLTLETVDDTSVPSMHNEEVPQEQTALRSNKVPHYINIHAAATLGKINSTSSKNMEHSFQQHQIHDIPGRLSDVTVEAKKPDFPSQSDDNGKLITTSPSQGIGGESQTKAIPDLPLGLQMNAIGRISDTDEDGPVSPADLSAALASNTDLSDSLGSKTVQVKSFEDKLLPMASDLSEPSGVKTGGETETIVSKTSPTTVENSIKATPERELPTASEVREMATSIKALLKILSSYSTKLRLEDDVDDSQTGLLPVRSRTADSRVTINNTNTEKELTKINITPKLQMADAFHPKLQHDENVNTLFNTEKELTKINITPKLQMADAFHPKLQHDKNVNTLFKSPKTSLTLTNYNKNNPYVNFPQSSPIQPSYVDSGGFENIQKQPSTDLSSYNWNSGQVQAHEQRPLDSNPTKSSLQPQLGADQWSPGNEVARVTEELKDLNLPSIEDDPTVREVQKIVAEDNVFASQKRKAIQKHEQQVSGPITHLLGKLGVFGRNNIPKHKVKGHQRNESRVKHKKKTTISGKRIIEMKPKGRRRDRNKIPRAGNNNNLSRQKELAFENSKPATKENTTRHGTNQTKSHSQRMTENSGKKNQLVSSINNTPGSGNNSRLNDSVSMHQNKIIASKTFLAKSLQSVQLNATSTEAVTDMKIKNQTKSKEKQHQSPLMEKLNKTKVTEMKKPNTMKIMKN